MTELCYETKMVRAEQGVSAKCRLRKGHLGSHEGVVFNQRWWWNQHGHGIMRRVHPTTGKPLKMRQLASE